MLIDNGIICHSGLGEGNGRCRFLGRKIPGWQWLWSVGRSFCRPQHWPGAFRRDGGQLSPVTVNANGVVTRAAIRSTLAGYAIGDAYTGADTDGKLAQKANRPPPWLAMSITDALRVDGTAVFIQQAGCTA